MSQDLHRDRHVQAIRDELKTQQPADDGSEEERIKLTPIAEHIAVSKEMLGSVHSDAENESPPFKPGDWVRDTRSGEPRKVWEVRAGHRHDWDVRVFGFLAIYDADELEPWQPRKGDRVVTPSGAVHEVYSVHGNLVMFYDECAWAMPIDRLRPAGGGGVRSAVKAMKPVMEVLGQQMHLLVRAYEDALRVERERRQQIRDSINAIGGRDDT